MGRLLWTILIHLSVSVCVDAILHNASLLVSILAIVGEISMHCHIIFSSFIVIGRKRYPIMTLILFLFFFTFFIYYSMRINI